MSVTSPLDRISDLQKESPDAKEFAGLVRSGKARLADAERPELSRESRFDLAYNAAHALCLAALRYTGYRSTNRYLVFQALPHTLKLGPEVWRVLAKAHERRNLGEYSGDVAIDERLVADTLRACKIVADAIDALPPI